MGWIVLASGTSKRSNEPAISLMKNYRISWNRATQQVLGEPEFVDLLIDPATKRMGLRRTAKSEVSFPVRKSASQDSWGISAEGPLKAAGILVASSHRRYAETTDGIVHIGIAELWPADDLTP